METTARRSEQRGVRVCGDRVNATRLPERNTRQQSIVKTSCNEGTKRTQLSFRHSWKTWQGVPMPYFNFDLVIGDDFRSQGGMILEGTEIAIDKADSLASELCVVRPELRSTGCAVRVTDGDSNELYRTPIDPIRPWLRSSWRA
jgi:hypothetical protein